MVSTEKHAAQARDPARVVGYGLQVSGQVLQPEDFSRMTVVQQVIVEAGGH